MRLLLRNDPFDECQFVNKQFDILLSLRNEEGVICNGISETISLVVRPMVNNVALSLDTNDSNPIHIDSAIVFTHGSGRITLTFKELSLSNNIYSLVVEPPPNCRYSFPELKIGPMYAILHKLRILKELPAIWYKDRGGKDNCIEIDICLIDDQGNQVVNRTVPLKMLLYYENMDLVPVQSILIRHNDTIMQINQDKCASVKVKIGEVSTRHRGQFFRVKISPQTKDMPQFADIGSCMTTAVDVRSKTNNRSAKVGVKMPTTISGNGLGDLGGLAGPLGLANPSISTLLPSSQGYDGFIPPVIQGKRAFDTFEQDLYPNIVGAGGGLPTNSSRLLSVVNSLQHTDAVGPISSTARDSAFPVPISLPGGFNSFNNGLNNNRSPPLSAVQTASKIPLAYHQASSISDEQAMEIFETVKDYVANLRASYQKFYWEPLKEAPSLQAKSKLASSLDQKWCMINPNAVIQNYQDLFTMNIFDNLNYLGKYFEDKIKEANEEEGVEEEDAMTMHQNNSNNSSNIEEGGTSNNNTAVAYNSNNDSSRNDDIKFSNEAKLNMDDKYGNNRAMSLSEYNSGAGKKPTKIFKDGSSQGLADGSDINRKNSNLDRSWMPWIDKFRTSSLFNSTLYNNQRLLSNSNIMANNSLNSRKSSAIIDYSGSASNSSYSDNSLMAMENNNNNMASALMSLSNCASSKIPIISAKSPFPDYSGKISGKTHNDLLSAFFKHESNLTSDHDDKVIDYLQDVGYILANDQNHGLITIGEDFLGMPVYNSNCVLIGFFVIDPSMSLTPESAGRSSDLPFVPLKDVKQHYVSHLDRIDLENQLQNHIKIKNIIRDASSGMNEQSGPVFCCDRSNVHSIKLEAWIYCIQNNYKPNMEM